PRRDGRLGQYQSDRGRLRRLLRHRQFRRQQRPQQQSARVAQHHCRVTVKVSGLTGLAASAVLTVVGLAAPAAAQVAISQGGGNYSVQVISCRDIPFRTVVRQEYDYSCGSAALATLLRYHYGRDVAEREVF